MSTSINYIGFSEFSSWEYTAKKAVIAYDMPAYRTPSRFWEKIINYFLFVKLDNIISKEAQKALLISPDSIHSALIKLDSHRKNKMLKDYPFFKKNLDRLEYLVSDIDVNVIPDAKFKRLVENTFIIINALKIIETESRCYLFPEKNPVKLTYDELRFLSNNISEFEPAEEQSDVYSHLIA